MNHFMLKTYDICQLIMFFLSHRSLYFLLFITWELVVQLLDLRAKKYLNLLLKWEVVLQHVQLTTEVKSAFQLLKEEPQ